MVNIELPWPEKRRKWSDGDLAELRAAYSSARNAEELDLAGLSAKLRRSMDSIICKAGRLGLTNPSRPVVSKRKDAPKFSSAEDLRAEQSRLAKERIAKNGHPRGMAGKKHAPETKKLLREKAAGRWAVMTRAERDQHALSILKGHVAANGGVNPERSRGSWKAGWREIAGRRIYFRSRWEANYARYLQWLKDRGEIVDWEYEPETFWFEKIKRGVRSYLPDFRVHEKNGSKPLHEVKGWMDARSRTTLKRMAKYHPQETIVLIREKQYNSIARSVAPMVEGWE